MARLLFMVKGMLPASQELAREIKLQACVERALESWRVRLGDSGSTDRGTLSTHEALASILSTR